MLVQVTQHHIQIGERGHSERCPVARALWEMGYSRVSAGDKIYLTKGDQTFQYRTPQIVREWMDRFDQDVLVQPFAFILDTPLKDRRRPCSSK